MLNRTTIRISLAVFAAGFASALGSVGEAHAHSSCTPPHLVSALRQVEAQCGKARVVSDHRPGATIRGTRRKSQHSFCNGTNGAIDAVFSNRACALSALRKTGYTILTYGRSSHIHIGTDGWRAGGTQLARRHQSRVRTAVRSERATRRSAYRRVARARTNDSQWGASQWSSGGWSNASADAGWSSARAQAGYAQRSGRRSARAARAYARASQGRRGYTRIARRQGASQSWGDWGGSW